ncbi:siderophore-iron reductase FhuF [Brevibacillus sp. SYP-B805]|uniref:siderophore-iron reductase FhuF n=1 Tax=Brevibacillus sp. SYP-B805 TaxID=1578199 RepID=UPI0013EBBD7F|nr:siderophore-iron reductase FhuF [Brevibacillus sp. SYP-B805]NGQ96633.1 siderophore-iron reductase FhuF [Brevibacillus sp. SYP-B805]
MSLPLSVLEQSFRIAIAPQPGGRLQFAAVKLLDPDQGQAFLEEAGAHLQSPSMAVTASLFVKRYLALVIGALYSMTFHTYGLNIRLDNLVLTTDDSWKMPRFLLLQPGERPAGGEREVWRERMIRHISNDNLQPLITAIAAYSRISPNVLWGHAAYLIHHYYRQWEREAETAELAERIRSDFRYLTEVQDPLLFGSCDKNPLNVTFAEVPHPAKQGEVVRIRRHCCLAYLLPEGKCCYTCPNLDEEKRIEQILAKER